MNPASLDIFNGIKNYNAWFHLAKNDIKQKFRRSIIGPFWITISMAIMISIMSIVFSLLFNQDIKKTIPFITVGIILWNFISSILNESSVCFCEAAPFIKNLPFPLSLHIYRVITRNLMILGFNSFIYILVIFIFGVNISIDIIKFIPGFLLLVFTLTGISLIFATVSARYRDIPQIISNILLILFYLTPIFWSKENISKNILIIQLNPLYYYFDVIRSPLLGQNSEGFSYIICFIITAITLIFSFIIFKKNYDKVPYWV